MRTWIALGLCAACGDNLPPAPPELPAWEKSLPPASVMGGHRGLAHARGIVHLHSPYSHDACDGMPRAGDLGPPNEACLANLRAALCATHIDFANLTDHDDTMADEELTTLFSMRGTDQPVMRGAEQIASRIVCEDGHAVLVTVGGENDLMPIMLDRHVAGTIPERHATYNGITATAAAAFRAAGGLVWIPHTEQRPREVIRAVDADGLEVYNLHANIDPEIRRDFLGLDPEGALVAAAEFADTNPGHPEPDLAFLAFFAPNQPAIDTWHALLGEGRHIAITAGSDAHENALPITLADGERGDSYRRVMRWFSNIALVADPTNVDQIQDALAGGRTFALMEVFGTPDGFDVRAVTPSGQIVELGGTIPVAEGAMLTVTLPHVLGLSPTLPVPTIRAKVIWVEPGGSVLELATADGLVNPELHVHLGAPGAYRVEVTIVPSHLGPYLRDLGTAPAEVEQTWIYASPIYVQ